MSPWLGRIIQSPVHGGVLAGITIPTLWWMYTSVPRANLAVAGVVACIALALIFRYPLIGTCIAAMISSSNLSVVLPSGFLLPLLVMTCAFALSRRILNGNLSLPASPLILAFLVYASLNVASLI